MSETLHAAALSLERRIAEIDVLLSETGPLRAEREHLSRALQEVAAATGATTEPTTPPEPRQRPAGGATGSGTGARKDSARRRRTPSGRRKRAPQGLNRERIVGFLRDNGATSASAIARGTGINRAVVYNNLSKLSAEGIVRSDDGADGTSRFALTG